MRTHTSLFLLVVASLTAVVGCAPSGSAGRAAAMGAMPATVTVFAAASLTGPFTMLGRQFERNHPATTVRFSFGASSTLAQQILAGAPADVFAAASASTMQQVVAGGSAADPRTFARNSAEIAVAPASAARVHRLSDLAGTGVRVALCEPAVPCGALAEQVLARAGVRVRPVTRGLNVKSTLAYVSSGEVDAAIVYRTDVLAAGKAVAGVPIPAAVNGSTAYPIAVLHSDASNALARDFADYVLSQPGQAVLARAGFAHP